MFKNIRKFESIKVKKDFVVIGGGLSGIVSAVQAARFGLKVALINNRGYLGGNSSAEIQKWSDGASSASEFNFYVLEGGIYLEMLLENLHYNPQGNPFIWEADLRDFIYKEKNIELFLNTNIDEVKMKEKSIIDCVVGSQQGSEIRYEFYGNFFLDDTGDGTIGYLSGAEYRIGREAKEEFDEKIALEKADNRVIPSTLTFFASNKNKAIKFKPPKFALDITKTDILKYRTLPKKEFFNYQWYYELGGELNQIKDSQEIIKKHYELVFGIWDYIKNSGKFDSENYDFSYIASVPGKRESRRLVGDYILKENDIVQQKKFKDAVGYGGRAIDLHAVDGIFSKELENYYYLLKGIYQIPFRCGYSKNIDNLFFAGRDMSVTHVAFGSTRVNGTLCTLAQALGLAAYLCIHKRIKPRDIYNKYIQELQQLLLKEDHFIPGIKNLDNKDKAKDAKILATSTKSFENIKRKKEVSLEKDYALIIPTINKIDNISVLVKNSRSSKLYYSIFKPSRVENWSPDEKIYGNYIELKPSKVFRWVKLSIKSPCSSGKLFMQIFKNKDISLGVSDEKIPGAITLKREKCGINRIYDAITLKKKDYIWQQTIFSICFKVAPNQNIYIPENIINGFQRTQNLPNLWMSNDLKEKETLQIKFRKIKEISQIILYFDADFNTDYLPLPQTGPGFKAANVLDVSAENLLYSKVMQLGYDGKKNAIPTLVKDYSIFCEINQENKLIAKIRNNYQRRNFIKFKPIKTKRVRIDFIKTNGVKNIRVFEIRIY